MTKVWVWFWLTDGDIKAVL